MNVCETSEKKKLAMATDEELLLARDGVARQKRGKKTF